MEPIHGGTLKSYREERDSLTVVWEDVSPDENWKWGDTSEELEKLKKRLQEQITETFAQFLGQDYTISEQAKLGVIIDQDGFILRRPT